MDDIKSQEVDWLWYPYIPYGKVTIVQGDPGEGKTSFALALVSLLTTGQVLPEQEDRAEPVNVIFQTAEDGLADTVKPRLEAYGADCKRVMVIDDSDFELTVADQRLEEAISETKARLIVFDPMQAFFGSGVDIHRANEVRNVFKKLCRIAEKTGCAVMLIGHMNKDKNGKSAYRGLGSIDFRAAARSVLVVGRAKDNPAFRVVAHDKSNLAPEGKSIAFELGEKCAFSWKGYCDVSVSDLLSGNGSIQNKTAQMEQVLRDLLKEPMKAYQIYEHAEKLGISERTVKTAKKNVGVVSRKVNGQWEWSLPDQPGE